jgi:hypothetical protein
MTRPFSGPDRSDLLLATGRCRKILRQLSHLAEARRLPSRPREWLAFIRQAESLQFYQCLPETLILGFLALIPSYEW